MYTQCKITSDKRYLIPDDTFTIPQKTSRVERQAEIFDTWDDWRSTTSASINAKVDLLGRIGGKFSYEYQSMKSRQYRQDSFSMRIQLRHRLYTVKQLPDSQVGGVIDINELLCSGSFYRWPGAHASGPASGSGPAASPQHGGCALLLHSLYWSWLTDYPLNLHLYPYFQQYCNGMQGVETLQYSNLWLCLCGTCTLLTRQELLFVLSYLAMLFESAYFPAEFLLVIDMSTIWKSHCLTCTVILSRILTISNLIFGLFLFLSFPLFISNPNEKEP